MQLKQLKHKNKTKTIAFLIATWWGSGCSSKAPGTVGSFCSLPLLIFAYWIDTVAFLSLIILLFLIGLWSTNVVLKSQTNQDPSFVVIDETVGQLLTFILLASSSISWYITVCGFVLFRLFDIWKPWPVSYFDKKVHNAFGVMMDDVIAGLYAGVILYMVSFLI